MNEIANSVIVSFTCGNGPEESRPYTSLLLVGQKQPGKDVAIINAFQGIEAYNLWQKLTVKEEKK